MALAPELLEILACPQCRGALAPTAGGDGLICARCRLCYPVRDDIPVMLPEEASPWAATPASDAAPPGGPRPGGDAGA